MKTNRIKNLKKRNAIFFAVLLICATGCSKSDPEWSVDPVIPVYLSGIESVNINNAGQYPFTTTEPIKKEAYMIGIRWVTDNSDPDGDQSITGPVNTGESRYQNIADNYTKRIYCNTVFNSRNPAGANVSQYFKEVNYLPAGINEGFVLLVAPDAGEHSFRVVYTNEDGEQHEYDTELIKLY
ncbi:MAG: DUF5034 domain-containing protein [Bacteroidales bacterium]|nr:DUF5034 domain-containing protein [Bacteroidales bacterium]